jgi:PAS domain S-box-containing protein
MVRLHKGREHVLSEEEMAKVCPDYRGRKVLGIHEFIPKMQWAVLAEINTKEAFAPLAELRRVIFLILFIAVNTAWLLGIYIARFISGPLHRLHKGTEIIGSGNLDYKVGTDTKDEVGQLSRAFDAMTENLKNTTTSIESLNKEAVERKRAEEVLKEAKAFTESTLNSIADIFYSFDLSGKFLIWNKTFNAISGYRDQELSSKKPIDFFLGEDIQRIAEAVERIYEEGTAKTEANFVLKDGRQIPCEFTGSILKDGKGNIIGFSGTGRDITERKQAEERVRESEEKFKTLYESSRDAIMILEPPLWKFTSGNPATLKLFGCKDEKEFTSLSPIDLSPEYQPDGAASSVKAQEMIKIAMEKGNHFFEWMHKRMDETEFYATVLLTRTKLKGKKVLQATVRDITESKKAEALRNQLLEQLAGANQELKDFAYVVSHDLKAPLRGIETIADWIATDYADKLDDDGKKQLHLLANRVDRMHNLIDGILQYSRIGRVEEEKVQINLNELVPEIIDMLAPPENIAITVENELPTITYELTRVTQVFQNLLSNAVKYMDKPKGQIKVGCVEENGFWKFSVADNGPGIEEKHFEKIFKIFQILAPRDESESTGIGLTIVKKIVELYKGKIWVESKVGEGSTFFFTLPKQNIGAEKKEELQASVVG